jgi:hypothetical protein
MVYEMKQINASLDKAETYINANKPHEARRVFDSTQLQWKTKKGWNKGAFNPKHPDVRILEARLAKVQKMVEELEEAEEASGN